MKYAHSSKLISKTFLNNEYLEPEVKRHENEYPEFRGILSTLLSWSFENTGDYIKEIYWKMDSDENIRDFINQTVRMGIEEREFHETPDSITKLVVSLQEVKSINAFMGLCPKCNPSPKSSR